MVDDVLISGLPLALTPISRTDLFEVEQGVPPTNTSGHNTIGALVDFVESQIITGDAVTALSIAAGVVTLDYTLGKDWTIALTSNVTSFLFTNLAGVGFVSEFELEIKQDATGSRTFALPASFKALGGSDTAISAAANTVTILSAKTFDNGTTWRYAMQESA